MDREEYRLKVLNFVHQLRVDPHDATTRLVLADFMEEYSGREGIQRTTAVLRSGLMVPNSLDMAAILHVLEEPVREGSERVVQGRLWDYQISRIYQDRVGISLGDYYDLWLLTFRYRLSKGCPADVSEEAGLVFSERREEGLSLRLTNEPDLNEEKAKRGV